MRRDKYHQHYHESAALLSCLQLEQRNNILSALTRCRNNSTLLANNCLFPIFSETKMKSLDCRYDLEISETVESMINQVWLSEWMLNRVFGGGGNTHFALSPDLIPNNLSLSNLCSFDIYRQSSRILRAMSHDLPPSDDPENDFNQGNKAWGLEEVDMDDFIDIKHELDDSYPHSDLSETSAEEEDELASVSAPSVPEETPLLEEQPSSPLPPSPLQCPSILSDNALDSSLELLHTIFDDLHHLHCCMPHPHIRHGMVAPRFRTRWATKDQRRSVCFAWFFNHLIE